MNLCIYKWSSIFHSNVPYGLIPVVHGQKTKDWLSSLAVKTRSFIRQAFVQQYKKWAVNEFTPSRPIKQWSPTQECQSMSVNSKKCSVSCLELSPGLSSSLLRYFYNNNMRGFIDISHLMIRPPVLVNNSHASSQNTKFLTGFEANRKPPSLPGEHVPRFLFGRWCPSRGRVPADTLGGNPPRLPASPLCRNSWTSRHSTAQDGNL